MLARLVALGAAVLVGLFTIGKPAQAEFIVTVDQVGSNVVATGTGSLDLTDLTQQAGTVAPLTVINGSIAEIDLGPSSITSNFYKTLMGPTSFGSFPGHLASNGTGDAIGVEGFGHFLFVESSYVSGSMLSDTATWDNTTFAKLNVTPGIYTWTWGSGPDADSFVLQIGVPEPASLILFGTGLVGFGVMHRRRRRAAAKL